MIDALPVEGRKTVRLLKRVTPEEPTRPSDFVNYGQAAEILGVSRFTIGRLIRSQGLAVYGSPVDKREKFVLRKDVERLLLPTLRSEV